MTTVTLMAKDAQGAVTDFLVAIIQDDEKAARHAAARLQQSVGRLLAILPKNDLEAKDG